MKPGKIYGVSVALLTMGVLFWGCSRENALVPKDIMGAWKTQSRDSSGVSIEFKEKSLIISSDLGVVENIIVEVREERDEGSGSTRYLVYYTDRGGKTASMAVIYSPENGGTLRFKSDQSILWKRSG